MEEAIRRAIEGGFIYGHKHGEYTNAYLVKVFLEAKEKVLLNPLFWQALQKTEDWDKSICRRCGRESMDCLKHNDDCVGEDMMGYLHYWHRFIDHIAEKKTVDSFFDGILKGGISS